MDYMQVKGLRVPVIFLISLLTVAILFSLQWLHQEYSIRQPISGRLEKLDVVDEVRIEEKAGWQQVTVKLADTKNLQQAFQQITDVVQEESPDDSTLKIILLDNPSPILEKVWNRSQFAVYEAIARGEYVKMEETVATLAREAGLTYYAIDIDANNIYLQFHHGDNYLYRVIQRSGEHALGKAFANRGGN